MHKSSRMLWIWIRIVHSGRLRECSIYKKGVVASEKQEKERLMFQEDAGQITKDGYNGAARNQTRPRKDSRGIISKTHNIHTSFYIQLVSRELDPCVAFRKTKFVHRDENDDDVWDRCVIAFISYRVLLPLNGNVQTYHIRNSSTTRELSQSHWD